MKLRLWALLILALVFVVGCTSHEVEIKPIRVEPIYIKVDVNIKLQKEFENLFAFEEKGEKKTAVPNKDTRKK